MEKLHRAVDFQKRNIFIQSYLTCRKLVLLLGTFFWFPFLLFHSIFIMYLNHFILKIQYKCLKETIQNPLKCFMVHYRILHLIKIHFVLVSVNVSWICVAHWCFLLSRMLQIRESLSHVAVDCSPMMNILYLPRPSRHKTAATWRLL